jgi:orotate phosphoribosyltransferase
MNHLITPDQIANMLLQIEAVSLNVRHPFLYSSGLYGPIYCDNRLILSYPKARDLIVQALKQKFLDNGLTECVIAGIATGGIAYAALLAQELNLPMIYIRSVAKNHGKMRAVEGRLERGQNVLLIEDLITTGKSALAAAQEAIKEGAVIERCYSIFSYNLPIAQANFQEVGIKPLPLCTLNCLLEVAKSLGSLSDHDHESIQSWQKDPSAWSHRHHSC